MWPVRLIWLLLGVIWISLEIKLARKNRVDSSAIVEKEEHSQRVLWLTLVISVGLALVFKTAAIMPIAIDYLPRQILALIIFASGLALRYWTVKMLGRFFTTDVAIYKQHQLIVAGPYCWVRHPSYSGVLIAFAGAGLAMGDGIALVLLTIPVFIAFNYRIHSEEKLLLNKFGKGYADYQQQTKKLLPWLF